MLRRAIFPVVVATACGLLASGAGAGRVGAPVQFVAARAAALVAGRPVAIHCESQVERRTHSPSELGYVGDAVIDRRTHRYVRSARTIVLAPRVCYALQRFAHAAVKPTTCDGKPCFLGRAIARGEPGPALCVRLPSGQRCFAIAAPEPRAFWSSYEDYAEALQALAHEAIHVRQSTVGAAVPPPWLIEAQAECSGMQWLAQVARRFGDTRADARAIARFIWLVRYPNDRTPLGPYGRTHPYWSRACRPGGPLDLRAGSVAPADWPNGPIPRR